MHVQLVGSWHGGHGRWFISRPNTMCYDWSVHVGVIHKCWKYNMKPDSRTRVLCKQTYSAAMCVLREAGRKREQQK